MHSLPGHHRSVVVTAVATALQVEKKLYKTVGHHCALDACEDYDHLTLSST